MTNFNFLKYKNFFLLLSFFLILASIILVFTKGLDFGVDFKGGTTIEIRLEKKIEIEKIRNSLSKLKINNYRSQIQDASSNGKVAVICKEYYNGKEISSFCKPGRESRHNSSYWDFTPYFGFGPSAHSFYGERRFWNVSSLNTYLKAIEQGTGCSREEIISPKDRFNEYIMLSLRRVIGMDVAYINSHFKVPDEFYNSLAVLIKRGDVVEQGGKLRVPPEKLFLSDGIIRELFCTGSVL